MLISYHWLKKFVDLKVKPEKLADLITLNLVEVESIAKKGDDTILEIENKGITNRPDCFSQLGLARETAAYLKLNLKDPLPKLAKIQPQPTKKLPLKIQIRQPKLCYRYTGLVLTDLQVGPSPKWLRVGVQNCGLNSINNVVDITNYVMLELGQPLHAFDYQKVADHQILVRLAQKGEIIETFEGDKIKLLPSTLVIADSQKPIAIAGIIGGKNTEINSQTKTLILESANFDKIANRRSEKELNLRTEASTRFEKGQDIALTLPALNRAAKLLQKVAGAKIASAIIDVQTKKVSPAQIKVSPAWLNRFLGLNLKPEQMAQILERLQLKTKIQKDQLLVTIPTFRPDLKMPADLAEEIARIYGYDKIPITLPSGPSQMPATNPQIKIRKKTKEFLKSAGFSEILTQPFLGEKILNLFELQPQSHLQVVNPLNIDQEYLRRSLIPSLLPLVKNNLKNFSQFKIFEIDKIFLPQKQKQPIEVTTLTLIAAGPNSYPLLKGTLEALFDFLGIKANFKPAPPLCFWEENQTATLLDSQGKRLGMAGKIKKVILSQLEIKANLSLAELNFDKIVKATNLSKTYQPIPKYPPIVEDLTFILKPKTRVGDLIQSIKDSSLIIQNIKLTDSYKNSRSFRITYQSSKKTLADREVKKVREKIIQEVKKKFQARLKSK